MSRYADMIAKAVSKEAISEVAPLIADIFDTRECQAIEEAIVAEVGSLEAAEDALDRELTDHPARSAVEMMAHLRAQSDCSQQAPESSGRSSTGATDRDSATNSRKGVGKRFDIVNASGLSRHC